MEAVPSCVLGYLMACPGEIISESLKMEETVCHAWQKAGEVAIISRQKRGRCPQRTRLKVTVSKDTPRMLRIVSMRSNPESKVHIMGTSTW